MKQFVFVSVHDYKAPSAVKKVGYFDGKRRAEKLIGELFGAKVTSVCCCCSGLFPKTISSGDSST